MQPATPIVFTPSPARPIALAGSVVFEAQRADGQKRFSSLQEAADFVAEVGGIVRLPPGDIPLAETLRVGARVRLVGAGREVTRLVALDPAMDAVLIEGSKSAIEGLGVTRAVAGTAAPGLGAGIAFRRQTHDVLISDCRIERHGVGIRHATERPSDQADAGYFLRLRGVIVEKAFDALARIENVSEMIMSECAFQLGAGDGLVLRNCANSRLGRSFVYGCRGAGLKIEKSPDYFLAENLFFSEFIVDSTGGHALAMDDCSRVAYRSGWVASAGVWLGPETLDWDEAWEVDWTRRPGRDAVGILIGEACDDIQIDTNYVINCSADGVRLVAPRDVSIARSIVHSNGRARARSAGIRLDWGASKTYENIQLIGNRCRNDAQFIGQGARAWQAFGLCVAAPGRGLTASLNDCSDPLHEADIVIESAPTESVIEGNLGRVVRLQGAPLWRRAMRRLLPASLRARLASSLRPRPPAERPARRS